MPVTAIGRTEMFRALGRTGAPASTASYARPRRRQGRAYVTPLRQAGPAHRNRRERRCRGRILEEVVALVVNDDERREVLDLDLPDGLHAELLVLDDLDLLDAVLGES